MNISFSATEVNYGQTAQSNPHTSKKTHFKGVKFTDLAKATLGKHPLDYDFWEGAMTTRSATVVGIGKDGKQLVATVKDDNDKTFYERTEKENAEAVDDLAIKVLKRLNVNV